jgi:hypothetical protein
MIDAPARECTGYIYAIRLADRDEYRYVGLTTKTPEKRLRQHLKVAASGRKTPFYDWLRKVAGRGVVVDVVQVVRGDPSALGYEEKYWIAELRGFGNRLLNISEGGLGPTGVVWSDEAREAARQRSLGRPGVSRPGDLNPFFGKTHSGEQRRRWSETRRGQNSGSDNPNFGKFGADHPSFGHTMSEVARAQLSESRRGSGNPNFGKTASAETRAKRSAAQKGRPKPSSVRSAHTRWHTNKGVVSEKCRFCAEELERNTEDHTGGQQS